jgi:hypothetical protein
MLRKIIFSVGLIFSLLVSMNASACDDKSCEIAYLSAAKQYTANSMRQAEAYRAERVAHSKNRERRAYALYVHLHLMMFGDLPTKQL